MSISGISGSTGFAAYAAQSGVGGIGAHRGPANGQSAGLNGGAATQGTSFTDRLSGAVEDLGKAQTKAEDSAAAYEYGTEQNLASVMIDQQVAQLGLQLAINVRNKALGAYKDIMNMPV